MTKWLLISLGIISAFVVGKQYVSAQILDIVDKPIETYIDRISEYTGKYEVGYEVNHGTWKEEHIWYSDTYENAISAYTSASVE